MKIKVPATLTLEPDTLENLEIGSVKYKNGTLQLKANKSIAGISQAV